MRERPLRRMLQLATGERCLDVGCGLGYMLSRLRDTGAELHGIDISPSSVAFVTRNITPNAQVASCLRLPYPDGSMDKVLFCEVIEHVEEDTAAIREIHRILKPGGRLVLSTPSLEGWLSTSRLRRLGHQHGKECHARDGYTRESLGRLLAREGFSIEEMQLHMFLFSELFMELTKVIYMLRYRSFEEQSDLLASQTTLPYRALRTCVDLLIPLCRLEDQVLIPLFQRGHTLLVSAHAR